MDRKTARRAENIMVLLATVVIATEGEVCKLTPVAAGDKSPAYLLPDEGQTELLILNGESQTSSQIFLDGKCLVELLGMGQPHTQNCSLHRPAVSDLNILRFSRRRERLTIEFKRNSTYDFLHEKVEKGRKLQVSPRQGEIQVAYNCSIGTRCHSAPPSRTALEAPRPPRPGRPGGPMSVPLPGYRRRGEDGESSSRLVSLSTHPVTIPSHPGLPPSPPSPPASPPSEAPPASSTETPNVIWIASGCAAAVLVVLAAALTLVCLRRRASGLVAAAQEREEPFQTVAQGLDFEHQRPEIGTRPSSCHSHSSINSTYGQI